MQDNHILLTNDDGIESPGLRAAVEAVLNFGAITVVAPSHQQTGTGRSLTGDKQSNLQPIEYRASGKIIPAYHCDCSPAQIVRHSLRTLFNGYKPDLLISGINYGENLGMNITCSGTVGAALEAASSGIPAIAISKQTDIESHHQYTNQDWAVSSHFLNSFAKMLLVKKLLPDVAVLKIDVPGAATPLTKWKLTKLAQVAYYQRIFEKPSVYSKIGEGKTIIEVDKEDLDPDTDIYAFAVEKLVSVTPLSLDLTSRVKISELHSHLSNRIDETHHG
jgi:5'/3'-nucleotidase